MRNGVHVCAHVRYACVYKPVLVSGRLRVCECEIECVCSSRVPFALPGLEGKNNNENTAHVCACEHVGMCIMGVCVRACARVRVCGCVRT